MSFFSFFFFAFFAFFLLFFLDFSLFLWYNINNKGCGFGSLLCVFSLLPFGRWGFVVGASVVGFVGSRSLPSSAFSLVSRVVRSVVRSGAGVAVGCSAGADSLVLSSALSAGGSVSLFAVGGPVASGSSALSGFWSGSCSFLSGVARRCASVRWWAGGLPGVPLRARLSGRSRALVSAVAGSRSGGLVAFVVGGSSASFGSWACVRLALLAGLPVVVFPVGCSCLCFPSSFSGVGSVGWVVAGSGVWSGGFRCVRGGLSV